MRTGRRRHGAPQSALCHSRTTKFSSVQHDKLWPTSIFVRRPSCPELTARTSATNHINRPFQALSENVFIRADIVSSALETFCSMGYISLLYFTLLTYLLTYLWNNTIPRDAYASTVYATIRCLSLCLSNCQRCMGTLVFCIPKTSVKFQWATPIGVQNTGGVGKILEFSLVGSISNNPIFRWP